MSRRTLHVPTNCTYLGRDARGNYRFSVPSSRSGTHGCTIWQDGSGGVCTCEQYHSTRVCELVRGRDLLVGLATRVELAEELLDLARDISQQLAKDADYVIPEELRRHLEEVQAAAGYFLEVGDPGVPAAGPGL